MHMCVNGSLQSPNPADACGEASLPLAWRSCRFLNHFAVLPHDQRQAERTVLHSDVVSGPLECPFGASHKGGCFARFARWVSVLLHTPINFRTNSISWLLEMASCFTGEISVANHDMDGEQRKTIFISVPGQAHSHSESWSKSKIAQRFSAGFRGHASESRKGRKNRSAVPDGTRSDPASFFPALKRRAIFKS